MKFFMFGYLFLLLASVSLPAVIKRGSVLDIQVLEHSEFSGRFEVNENGTIEYPLLADVPIVDVTTSELMNDLTLRLARHIDNPLVLVSIIDNLPIVIEVLGQVVNPGHVTTSKGASLQEVIKLAGGTLENADLSRIKIIYHDRPQTPMLYDLNKFIKHGDIDNMPELEENDKIVVLVLEHTNKVKIIGAVRKPGLVELDEKMNVFELIYLAGGPDEKADLSRVRRFSQKTDSSSVEEFLDIQSYLDKGKMDEIPIVNEGDVIIIYSKWFDWKTMLSVLNNALLLVVTIQTFAGLFGK
ncbi:MAG TPA: polysaccharide biosynthesis/export family protein [Chitinispirillaceae bacterium]|nr:polysaccharide biosynthesis/export family protein [Chitinispirillaceae bacterium]